MSLLNIDNELLAQAASGNPDSINRLMELAQPKVQQYIYRLTLDHQTTQDIVQETLIDMAKCLGQLENYDRFWPWLRRISFNKLMNNRKKESRQRDIAEKLYAGTKSEQAKGLSNLISEELSQLVMQSMRSLKNDHRRILVLRCYEDMTYPEIASIMDRSEFGARMLFVRAKNALKKKLAKNGLTKAALPTALIVFGKLTSDSQAAAVEISSAALKAGSAATIAANLTATSAVIKLAAACLAISTASYMLSAGTSSQNSVGPSYSQVPAHMLCVMASPQNTTEKWYSYPQGETGPFLSRFTARDSQTGHTIAQWFRTASGNYFYDRANETVYLVNHNYYNNDYSIITLPTDSHQMTSALNTMYGTQDSFDDYIKYSGTGLFYLKGVDLKGQPYTQAGIHQNIPKEEYFNLTWAKTARLEDLRDDIHKLGYAGFTVSGQINQKQVNGRGVIPFTIESYRNNTPWLYMSVANTDYYANASSFPSDLARPWFGLHTIDSIRRNAALNSASSLIKNDNQSIAISIQYENWQIIYSVKPDRDLIDSIKLVDSNGLEFGNLIFNYSTEAIVKPADTKSPQAIDSFNEFISKVVQ